MKNLRIAAPIALLALSACATAVDVRSVAAIGSPPTFELRGKNLAELDQQAQRLCPHGHQVINQWQRQQGLDTETPGKMRSAWVQASQWAGTLPPNEAQATVQCSA